MALRPPPPSTKLKGISLARWRCRVGVYFTGLSTRRIRMYLQLCTGGKGGQKPTHFEVGRLFRKHRSQILTTFLESMLSVFMFCQRRRWSSLRVGAPGLLAFCLPTSRPRSHAPDGRTHSPAHFTEENNRWGWRSELQCNSPGSCLCRLQRKSCSPNCLLSL